MICNKILGKVTKFWGKRTKTLGVVNRFMVGGGGGTMCPPPLGFIGLRQPSNANACWLVLIYNTLIITNVDTRLFEYVPYILLFFSVNFLQITWIRPQKSFQTKILEMTSLVNHHPVGLNIIISKDKVLLDSQC